MNGPLSPSGSCPSCRRPWPDCACGDGGAMLADAHADAEPEFRGRARLIGIDVDSIEVGDILTTGEDIEVSGAWHCSAPGCGLRSVDRAVIEDHIAHLRQQVLYRRRPRRGRLVIEDDTAQLRRHAPFGEDAGADEER